MVACYGMIVLYTMTVLSSTLLMKKLRENGLVTNTISIITKTNGGKLAIMIKIEYRNNSSLEKLLEISHQ